MDEIERKTMQDIKDYVKSLDTPDNKVFQENSLIIMSCFAKAIEFIEQNAKLRQPPCSKCGLGSHPVFGAQCMSDDCPSKCNDL